jgi:hypothetical protein
MVRQHRRPDHPSMTKLVMFRHKRIHLPLAATAFATAVSLAACGGSSPSTTTNAAASAGAPTSGQPGREAYRFSDCMRAHGVSNFPDPQIHQDGNQVSVIVSLNPTIVSSPAFKSAQQACGKSVGLGQAAPALSGAGPQRQAQEALAFARCMRGRGFPSPTACSLLPTSNER